MLIFLLSGQLPSRKNAGKRRALQDEGLPREFIDMDKPSFLCEERMKNRWMFK
jgi:hypothetical protein